MKQSLSVRLDPELLAAARECAERENRTLTNFLETIIRRHIDAASGHASRYRRPDGKHQRTDL